MNKLLLVIVMSLIGNAIAWLHMNAQFKWEWAKSIWWIVMGGIPISFLFYYSTKLSYEHFGILTALFLKELPSFKIWISLLLALAIILLNISNTIDKI